MKSAKSVGIIVLKNDKVLLVREEEKSGHITGTYNTPAGRPEAGETPIQTALRELYEETGLIANENDLLKLPKEYSAVIKRKSGETILFYHTVFVCKKFRGEIRPAVDVTPQWISITEISKLPMLPNIEDMIKEAQKLS